MNKELPPSTSLDFGGKKITIERKETKVWKTFFFE
jgi:hypothetical protein